MNALEHIRDSVPTLVINVPESVSRWQQFMTLTRSSLGEVYQFPASPIIDQRAEAFEWRDLVRESQAANEKYSNVKVFLAQDKTLEREAKQHEYAATYSLYRSTISALKYGLECGWSRFMIMEDDAVPRIDVLTSLTSPPPSSELIVWGGAIPMGAHNTDGKRYLEGRQSAYKIIKKPAINRYIATAYEVTRSAAEAHLYHLTTAPHAVDCAWWYTMDSADSLWVDPVAFVQQGQSDRIDKLREGISTR